MTVLCSPPAWVSRESSPVQVLTTQLLGHNCCGAGSWWASPLYSGFPTQNSSVQTTAQLLNYQPWTKQKHNPTGCTLNSYVWLILGNESTGIKIMMIIPTHVLSVIAVGKLASWNTLLSSGIPSLTQHQQQRWTLHYTEQWAATAGVMMTQTISKGLGKTLWPSVLLLLWVRSMVLFLIMGRMLLWLPVTRPHLRKPARKLDLNRVNIGSERKTRPSGGQAAQQHCLGRDVTERTFFNSWFVLKPARVSKVHEPLT